MIQVQHDLSKIGDMLGNIAVISKSAMIEQSSKAGSKVRDAVRRRFLASQTQWVQYYAEDKYGNRRRVIAKQGTNVLGKRIAHRSKQNFDNPSNMSNFITSFTHETTGTTIVGGTHKSFNPAKIRNGKIVGRLGRVGGVSQQTVAILEKLNYGNRSGQYANKLLWNGKKESIRQFEGKWKARNFFEDGWSDTKAIVIEDMTTTLQKLIGERANNVDLTKKVKNVI